MTRTMALSARQVLGQLQDAASSRHLTPRLTRMRAVRTGFRSFFSCSVVARGFSPFPRRHLLVGASATPVQRRGDGTPQVDRIVKRAYRAQGTNCSPEPAGISAIEGGR